MLAHGLPSFNGLVFEAVGVERHLGAIIQKSISDIRIETSQCDTVRSRFTIENKPLRRWGLRC